MLNFFITDVALEICMPKCVLNCSLTANQGKYSYDPVSKVLLWDIGRIELPKLPNIRGTVSIDMSHVFFEFTQGYNLYIYDMLAVFFSYIKMFAGHKFANIQCCQLFK